MARLGTRHNEPVKKGHRDLTVSLRTPRSGLRRSHASPAAVRLGPSTGEGSQHTNTDDRLPSSISRLRVRKPGREPIGYAIAVLGTAWLTAALLPVRADMTPLSKGFGFLVVVVVAAGVGGLGPGLAASVFGFLTFNFFFLPPYDTFVISRPEDVV